MLNDAASAPPSVQVSVSSSGSVADSVLPILLPVAVFSSIDRVMLLPSANTGASLTSVTVIVTVMLSVAVPSETVTVTV